MKNKILISALFILISLFLGSNKVSAEISNENFIRIGVEQGLSSSNITCIYQDSIGYMWIGTDNGLNKYNGYNVEIYNYEINNNKSLSSTYITDIFEDNIGNIWVGTKSGLNIIHKDSGDVERIPVGVNIPEGISDPKITTVFEDSRKNIWVGTENGLNRYNNEKNEFEKYLSTSEEGRRLDDSYITSIKEHDSGYLLIGTRQGIHSINLSDYRTVEKSEKTKRYIYNMAEDKEGNQWISSNSGIFKYIIESDRLEQFDLDIPEKLNIYSDFIFCDSSNNLWFSGSNGAIKYSIESDKYTIYKNDYSYDYSLSSDYVKCFYEDSNGNIWIGTVNGLNILNNQQQFTTITNLGNDNSYRNITEVFSDSNDELWLGTLYNGIFKYNKETKKAERFYYNQDDILNTNAINTVIDGPNNQLIAATKSGILILNKDNGSYLRLSEDEIGHAYNEEILDVYYENNILWIASYLGFYSYDISSKEFNDYNYIFDYLNITMEGIRCIYQDDNNEDILWLGGENQGGLLKFNKETKDAKRYINEIYNDVSISYNSVNNIVSDGLGNLWIGSDYGLNKFNIENETFLNYTDKDGLGSNYIKSLLFDENKEKLWIATNDGISYLDIRDNEFMNYTSIDGIAGNEFNKNSVVLMPNKDIMFGGSMGITYFSPDKVSEYQQKDIDVIIDYLNTNDITEYNTDKIELSYKHIAFRISYFTTNYVQNEKIVYEYMLAGIDSDWTYAGNDNIVRYNSLNPGKYVFKVRAKSNGKISDIEEVHITIEEPFWKSKLAYCIYLSIIAAIVFAILNHVKILENLVRQRTIELKGQLDENKKLYSKLINEEKFKNSFFVNLSHELRTPLNVILSATQLMDVLDNDNEKGMNKYITIIKKSSNSLLKIINDIIDSSKIETGYYHINKKVVDIVYVVEEAALNMNEYIKANGLELVIDPEIEEKQVYCDATEIERIVVNLLSNAVKFTPEGGSIKLFINDKGEKVEIIVEDTGTGISKADQEFIFNRFEQGENSTFTNISSSGIGLMLVKYLVELHNGEIKLESEVGKGSRFIILLPVKL